jgi:hypothetical protein
VKKLPLATVALFSATQASAQPVWDKVEFGMTRAQVEALYPSGNGVSYQRKAIEISHVKITDKCGAEANIRFDVDGTVQEVMIAGNPSMGGRCSNDVLTALSAKYGQPANWDSSQGSILARQGKIAMWSRPDGIAMRFRSSKMVALAGEVCSRPAGN